MMVLPADLRTLVVVSTFNRKDLTGLTLDSLARNKAPRTAVVILDDASTDYSENWLGQWGWPVVRNPASVGVGAMAKQRFDRALAADETYGFFIFCDNDLLFGKAFDTRMRSFWERVFKRSGSSLLLSGYRSVCYDVKEQPEDLLLVERAGGACLASDRTGVKTILEKIQDWSNLWDMHTGSLPCYCPRRSLVQHTGIHGPGRNGPSWDEALDFVGEGAW